MNHIIRIKCPFDGAVLSVREQTGIETKTISCPVCRNKYPFTQYERILPQTDIFDSLGVITVVGTGHSYRLKTGRNIIGRMAQKSEADFQIDTAGKLMMSREHIVIDVKQNPGNRFVHIISLYKEKVNPTFINNKQLLYGDCMTLNHGDVIGLPDATLRFEIPGS